MWLVTSIEWKLVWGVRIKGIFGAGAVSEADGLDDRVNINCRIILDRNANLTSNTTYFTVGQSNAVELTEQRKPHFWNR